LQEPLIGGPTGARPTASNPGLLDRASLQEEGNLMADHNDPNAVNSIFSDIDVSAADLYDLFGFPSDDTAGGEKVVIALTFASVPESGVLDTDMLYRIQIDAGSRLTWLSRDDHSLESLLRYIDALKD